MKRGSLRFLILACLFVTLALAFLVLGIIRVTTLIEFAYRVNEPTNLLDSFLINADFMLCFLICTATLSLSGGTIPFITVFLRREGKKWYAVIILVLAILIALGAIITFASLPIAGALRPESTSSSSSYPY